MNVGKDAQYACHLSKHESFSETISHIDRNQKGLISGESMGAVHIAISYLWEYNERKSLDHSISHRQKQACSLIQYV